ncbi:hypothetical protein PSP31121_05019 [Pandoraea sputorum]|uniref:Uncharacterized protein n=1 Tax=Pandoraea sputorum TaxID=93222 RepID=A0A5E5BGC9_9BURK|nr:hypothetical protein PSP31121_05019 [Pandoraea sputorum]
MCIQIPLVLYAVALLALSTTLYLTGRHMNRVWTEMRNELRELRGAANARTVTDSPDTRSGGTRTSSGSDLDSGL